MLSPLCDRQPLAFAANSVTISIVMGVVKHKSNLIVAAFLLVVWFPALCLAQVTEQDDKLDSLFEQLKQPDLENWKTVEDEITLIWSRSGSPSVDLLLQLGQKALENEDTKTAIEHFTAVTDHAPDFAEGWNMRATAYFVAGLYGPAVADIKRTLQLNPRHFGAMSGFAMILEETGKPQQALEVWRIVRDLHPNHPNIKQVFERLERQEMGREL